jgi:CoA:oxalate CoA-transferase
MRLANQPELKAEIEGVLRDKPTAHWLTVFETAGIPAGPINNVKQAIAHPQVPARNMLVTVEDPQSGTLRLAGNPMKISDATDPSTREPAPDLDADRAAILKELSL